MSRIFYGNAIARAIRLIDRSLSIRLIVIRSFESTGQLILRYQDFYGVGFTIALGFLSPSLFTRLIPH